MKLLPLSYSLGIVEVIYMYVCISSFAASPACSYFITFGISKFVYMTFYYLGYHLNGLGLVFSYYDVQPSGRTVESVSMFYWLTRLNKISSASFASPSLGHDMIIKELNNYMGPIIERFDL